MSYILDALRRADAERERGAVPGLHAQQDPFEESEAPAANARPVLLIAVVLLAVALAGVLGWTWWRGDTPAAVVAVQAPPAPGPTPIDPAASPTTPPLPSPAPETPAPAARTEPPSRSTAPAPRTPEREATSSKARSDTPARTEDKPAATESRRSPERAPAPRAADNSASAPAAAPRTPVPDAPRVYTLDSLPSHIRAELPRLSIGGASYSENPASRMLIVNGQVFHEHDRLGPNHSLEEIGLKHAVLDYKGFRYRLTF